MQYFFLIAYCHWSPKEEELLQFWTFSGYFGLSVTIFFKVVGEMVKNVIERDFFVKWALSTIL